MKNFVYNALPSRVIFGNGTLDQVVQEITSLGCSKALILTTPHQVAVGEKVKELVGDKAVGRYANATMHTPTDVTDDAIGVVQKLGVDVVIAVGGGSTIGLAKAIALRTDLPQIVIPTTYAGSEATPIIGQTENGLKTTQKTLKVLPEVIIYDVSLTVTLPPRMTITSGLNAIAHAVEALYSKEASPITDTLAVQGISSIAKALPVIMNDSENLDARSEALYGAWACGTCLGAVGMGLHHKLCHTLGGTFNMPHAETHTVILPHSMAYNAPYAQEAMEKVAKSLGVSNAAQGIFDLSKSLGAPSTLKELGMKEEDLGKAADIASKSPYPNPAPLERAKLFQLLKNAYEGVRPT
ncbi:iron-containing alcohol dehydrogenase [Desarmillaria tabescens]|uniref:Iron-containing alcohol dehydrogenase n=1 Tax=Armillaria tabescens TaxID=1929756 RepID=A0AA39KBE8_ARMTA|nr:iron-containing alcohol dehydrogenase [Desarmillaria tabescens]KAK0457887.1 iron-containing alcohol dehydrogenase [Desarmillaria tabescens]